MPHRKTATAPNEATPKIDEPALDIWLECIPNLSEGKNSALLREIATVAQLAGVHVAQTTSDVDHNRSVCTWFGKGRDLLSASSAVLELLLESLSLAGHQGIHPRTGLLDVVPFVPLAGFAPAANPSATLPRSSLASSTLALAKACARRCAMQLAEEHQVPTFLYEAAASSPDRRNLADHRRAIANQGLDVWQPDFGPSIAHIRAGSTLVAAREPLVAFNLDLETTELHKAKRIASRIRATHREGLPGVKALGLFLQTRQAAQVSVNLTDATATTLPELVERVSYEAAQLGTEIRSGELIGLTTRPATDGATAQDLFLDELNAQHFVEHHLEQLEQPRR